MALPTMGETMGFTQNNRMSNTVFGAAPAATPAIFFTGLVNMHFRQ